MKTLFTRLTVLLLVVGIQAHALDDASKAPAPKAPNVVLILADDLGWNDLTCYGADLHETPHLNWFAQQGVLFTNAYAMSVCSPSRAALLTGKHAARLHITTWAEGSRGGPKKRRMIEASSLHDLPQTETTLARRFHDAGYLTALVGKWHLGDADHTPEAHGFDVNIGGTQWGAPQTYFSPYSGRGQFGPEFRFVPHLEFGKPGEYLTDRLTEEALSVIDHAGDKPFFLYLAHHAPHTPIEAKADDVRYFESKIESLLDDVRRFDTRHQPHQCHQNAVYAAMIKSLDDSVGRVLDHLKKRGLDQNTIVIFTSDNGGYIGTDKGQVLAVTNNGPLRSGKAALYEGGVRVPMLIRWPGVTPTGEKCHEPVVLMDLFHTLTRPLAAATPDDVSEEPADGVDLKNLLQNPTQKLSRQALYFHFPHYYATTTPVSAVREGDWKLLEYLEDGRTELYNLRDDLSEKTDLATQMPDKTATLLKQLRLWRTQVGAAMPAANPTFK